MTKYAAFLRGINVGGRVVKKDELKACFEGMGLANVKTVIQSGNVLFESDETKPEKLKELIEAGLTKTFSYPAKVIIQTISDLTKIIENYPFEAEPEKHNYVVFLSDGVGPELLDQFDAQSKIEKAALGDDVIYWQVPKGMTLDTPFAILLSKTKYKTANTVRNINTLQKMIS